MYTGENRGAHFQSPLPRRIHLVATETIMWGRLFKRMWPGIAGQDLEELEQRMIRSLKTECESTMTRKELGIRLRQLSSRLNNLPPDMNNKLMGG